LPFFIFPALSGQLTCARIVAITAADSAVIAAHHKSPATGHRKPIVGSKDPCSAGAVMKEISYGSTDQQQVAWVTLALRASALLSSVQGSKLASAPTQPQLRLIGGHKRARAARQVATFLHLDRRIPSGRPLHLFRRV
jgi:hypothetical protein